jgi:hypothetical protein
LLPAWLISTYAVSISLRPQNYSEWSSARDEQTAALAPDEAAGQTKNFRLA